MNINEEETPISYPLLLIHGLIEHDFNSTCKNDCNEIFLTLKANNNKHISKTLIENRQFKLLVELQKGINEIILNTSCLLTKTLLLKHEPRKTSNFIQPLYIKCTEHNGKFQAPPHEDNSEKSACKRINTACKILQSFIAEKLNELKLERRTFQVVPCQVFNSKLTLQEAKEMKQQEIWEHLGREIMNSTIGSKNVKYLAFLSFTRYQEELYNNNVKTYEDLLKITNCYVAIGGGGLALFGTACLYTWPENVEDITNRFRNNTLVNRYQFLDDSYYRGTEGACFSTTLGSVLHELCHTFDLGHTNEGIMSRGFDFIERTFVSSNNQNKYTIGTSKTCYSSIRNYEFTSNIYNKPVKDDEIYFTKSSAAFLSYHKWLNNYDNINVSLTYDRNLQLIKSTSGIRVIEIRSTSDELVLYNWLFTYKVLKYSFAIPNNKFQQGSMLVVIDNVGNILKEVHTIK